MIEPPEEARDERQLRADRERGRGLPLDRLDVLVPLGRVVRIGRVGGDLAPRAVDVDRRPDVDWHAAIVDPSLARLASRGLPSRRAAAARVGPPAGARRGAVPRRGADVPLEAVVRGLRGARRRRRLDRRFGRDRGGARAPGFAFPPPSRAATGDRRRAGGCARRGAWLVARAHGRRRRGVSPPARRAVSGVDGRTRVREVAAAQGRRDGVDFIAVA